MGGLTKLEDRPVERESLTLDDLREELDRHVSGVIAARGGGLKLELPSTGTAAAAPATETAVMPAPDAIGAPASAADGRPVVPLFLDLPLVEEVLDNLLSNACVHATKRVAFDMRVDAGVLTVVVTDDGPGFTPEALREEVLDNLLSNACVHATKRVAFDMRVDAGVLTVVVTDDGPGFTPEALRRGCDPFFSENKSAEHFGLGLNVSSILCGLHRGKIALTNAETGGARVIATFDVRSEWESAS